MEVKSSEMNDSAIKCFMNEGCDSHLQQNFVDFIKVIFDKNLAEDVSDLDFESELESEDVSCICK